MFSAWLTLEARGYLVRTCDGRRSENVGPKMSVLQCKCGSRYTLPYIAKQVRCDARATQDYHLRTPEGMSEDQCCQTNEDPMLEHLKATPVSCEVLN